MWPGFMQAAQVVGEVVSSGHRHTRATPDTEESEVQSPAQSALNIITLVGRLRYPHYESVCSLDT
jgi:hypothetical protein